MDLPAIIVKGRVSFYPCEENPLIMVTLKLYSLTLTFQRVKLFTGVRTSVFFPVKIKSARESHFFNFFTGKKPISRQLFGQFSSFITPTFFFFSQAKIWQKLVFSRDILPNFFTCINFFFTGMIFVKFHGQICLFTGTFLRFFRLFHGYEFDFQGKKKTLS